MKTTVAPSIKFATNSFVTGRPPIEHPRSSPQRYCSTTVVGATKCQLALSVRLGRSYPVPDSSAFPVRSRRAERAFRLSHYHHQNTCSKL